MKIKKLNNLHWLLMLFIAVCESTNSNNYHYRHYSTGKIASNSNTDFRERAVQLRKARSSPNQSNNNSPTNLNTSASSLQKVSFLPEDSFEPINKRHYTHHSQQHHGTKNGNSNVKRDLTEPISFLNAVVNDHLTSSTNQDSDTVRYPPNKAFKLSSPSLTAHNNEPQSFSRRQRDFSESPINPTGSASDTSESMNSDDHESEPGSPLSSGTQNSHHDDSNEDFPSSSSGSSSSTNSNSASSTGSNLDEESPAPYDSFGPSSMDDETHTRGIGSNTLDEDEHSSLHHPSTPNVGSQPMSSLSSRPPTLSYNNNPNSYLSQFSGGPSPRRPMSSGYRNIYSAASPMIGSFPGPTGYRPILSPLNYPLISSASSSPLAGSYKAMSSESYPSAPMTTKYRGYTPVTSGSSAFVPSDESSSPMFSSPFSFDSFPSSSDNFGSTPTNFGFKSSSSYGDLMGLNNNWYLNQQQYLPLMMKQAGYPMMGGYAMQYQTTTQSPSTEEAPKEKDKETTGKTKNRLRFNLNRLQAIRLNNLKLPSLFNWGKNSTTTTTQSSIN